MSWNFLSQRNGSIWSPSHQTHLSAQERGKEFWGWVFITEIQVSVSLVILQPLPGTGLNKRIKGKGVSCFSFFFFKGCLPFLSELELLLSPGCSQPSSPAGPLCPGAQMEHGKPLDLASVCVWLHLNMTRLCKRVCLVTYVFGIFDLRFLFYQIVFPLVSTTSHIATDILSSLIHIGVLLLPNSFYLEGCFSFILL